MLHGPVMVQNISAQKTIFVKIYFNYAIPNDLIAQADFQVYAEHFSQALKLVCQVQHEKILNWALKCP